MIDESVFHDVIVKYKNFTCKPIQLSWKDDSDNGRMGTRGDSLYVQSTI